MGEAPVGSRHGEARAAPPRRATAPFAGRGVLLLAVALGLASAWLPWFVLKPNRLVVGQAAGLQQLDASLWWPLLVVWLAAAASAPWRAAARLVAVPAAAVATALVVRAAAEGARLLALGEPSSARVSLGTGFWLALAACYVLWFAATRLARGRNLVPPAAALTAAFVVWLAAGGQFADLGLARELAAQGNDFRAELGRHLALSGTSLLFGVAIGVPAAVAAHRRPAVAAWLLPTVAFFQTVPSLALFGLLLPLLARLGQGLSVGGALLLGLLLLPLAAYPRLPRPARWLVVVVAALPLLLWVTLLATIVAGAASALLGGAPVGVGLPRLDEPLAALGVRGIGAAPALIALTLYSLLPIVRNAYEGLRGVPEAAVQAGRGMGMSGRQVLTRVELPLALPVMVAGVRGAAVLVVGITTVAFLIGAGGLGVFIQRGIDQVVPDLVLLGALPVILLALLADAALRALGALLTPRPLRRRSSHAR